MDKHSRSVALAAALQDCVELGLDMGIPMQPITETVDELIIEWCSKKRDVVCAASLEEAVTSAMALRVSDSVACEDEQEPIDPLVMKIMADKFSKRYGEKLKEQHLVLMKRFMLADDGWLKKEFGRIKRTARKEVSSYLAALPVSDNLLREGLTNALAEIKTLNVSDVSEGSLAKFLVVLDLIDEVVSDGEK